MVMDLGALLVRACVHNHSEANCYCSLQPPEKEKYCAVWKRLLPSTSEIAKAASSSIVPSQGNGVSASSGLAQSPSVTAPSLEAPGFPHAPPGASSDGAVTLGAWAKP